MREENKSQIEGENQGIPTPKKKVELNMPSAIIVAALIIGGAIMFGGGKTKTNEASGDSNLSLISRIETTDFVRGDQNAEITIIEYADFSCGYCGVYHPTLQKIIKDYEGKVRWVYRHLPIFNIEAAVASQCVGNLAGNQAFWNFADTLYSNREKRDADYYEELALKEGASLEDYNRCIENPTVKSKIQSDFSQARILLGLNSTPHSVLVDKSGREFSFAGALSYENLKGVLDKLLQ